MGGNTTTPIPKNGLNRQEAFDRFSLIVNGPALFNAIVTAFDLGIFPLLEATPGVDLPQLAEHTGIRAEKLRVLMFALCSTGLVCPSEGGYANAEFASEFLAHDGPDSWSHILKGWQRLYYPAFSHLTEALQQDRNSALDHYPGEEETLYARLQHSPDLQAVLHRAMSAFTLQSLPGLVDHTNLAATRHLLDVGGGDGTTALALVRRWPALSITILDMPSVAATAGKFSAHERITVVGGDVFEMELPAPVDAVLFSHFLEVFSTAQIQTLLAKAFAVLRPGGRVLIYGFNASPRETDGIYSARLALYLTTLATGNGMTYPATDYEKWLHLVGFEEVHTISGLAYEHGLTSGRKPVDTDGFT
jgi:SAM-dependent methyltransferase